MLQLTTQLILASASPRRKDLLKQVGLACTVVPSTIDEATVLESTPELLVCRLAEMKARDVASSYPTALVLGADTTVVLEGKMVGKPESADHARSILRKHSGKRHTVFTGYSMVHVQTGRCISKAEHTDVVFGSLNESEIEAYVRDGSPMDKAGAYGYQDRLGPFFVESIHGDYYNVIGLPLRSIYKTLLREFSDLVRVS